MDQPVKPKRRAPWLLGKWPSAVALVVIAFGGGYLLRWGCAPAPTAGTAAATTAPPAAAEIWTCSMHPQITRSGPGRCPICGMDLVRVEAAGADEMAGLRQFSTSEAGRALMDIQTAPVERRFVTATVRMVGKIDYDETKLAYIAAWMPGRLDRLYVDYTGIVVRKGDHMVKLYSPELVSAQEELIQALRAVKELSRSDVGIVRETAEATVKAAREKLRLLGLTAEQIAAVEKRGKTEDHVTIYAPIGGVVIAKHAQQGMYVKTGTRIYTIADISRVWVKLDAYESDLQWLRYGQKVEFETVAHPGETFTGTVVFIDPILTETTRTVKVRVNAANPQGKLKPGMFVKALARAEVAAGGKVMDKALIGKWISPMHPEVVKDGPGKCDVCGMPLVPAESLGYVGVDPAKAEKPLVIPVSAALVTGKRAIVYVDVPGKDKPTYEGREIVLGPRAGDYYLVRAGLKEGDRVVTKGNFKIDSALQIQAKPSMMSPEGGAAAGGHQHAAHGERPKPGAGAAMTVEITAESRRQLHAVLAAAEEAGKAAGGEDLAGARSAFAALQKAVRAVDMKLLKGHAHMLWMETSMGLANDAVEGSQAKTLPEARRAAESLRRNASLLRSRFGLTHEHPAGPAAGDETALWTCSMHPEVRLPAPGKCPKCNMDLIPLRRGDKAHTHD